MVRLPQIRVSALGWFFLFLFALMTFLYLATSSLSPFKGRQSHAVNSNVIPPFSSKIRFEIQNHSIEKEGESLVSKRIDPFTSVGKGKEKVEGISVNDLLCVCIQAAKLGASALRDVYNEHSFSITNKIFSKEQAEVLTSADTISNHLILSMLHKYYPSLNIVSEEKADLTFPKPHLVNITSQNLLPRSQPLLNASEITIWVDPLDATQEFTEGLHQFVTTMICVAYRGRPLIGVIQEAFHEENVSVSGSTFWAVEDVAVSPNLLNLPESKEANNKKIIISRSHQGKLGEMLKDAMKGDAAYENYSVVEAGGSGYKAMQLIRGKADLYLHVTPIKKWDICAANLLINEVGGQFATLDSSPLSYAATKQDTLAAISQIRSGFFATINQKDSFTDIINNIKSYMIVLTIAL